MCPQTPLSLRSGKWREHLNNVDVKTIPALKVSAHGFTLQNETIFHADFGLVSLAARIIGTKEVDNHYYEFLFNAHLTIERKGIIICDKEVRQMIAKILWKLVSELFEKAIDQNGNEDKFWIFLTPSYTLHHTKHFSYVVEDAALLIERLNNPSNKHLQLLRSRFEATSNGISIFRILFRFRAKQQCSCKRATNPSQK